MASAVLAEQTYRRAQAPKTLVDTSPCTIVFRGGPAVVDKWDGEDIILPAEAKEAAAAQIPGWQSRDYEPCQITNVPWAVVQHVRNRAIVPGTRDPFQVGKATYRIGVLSTPTGQFVDKPELCAPLTDAQLAKFADAPEGIDRSVFLDSRRTGTTLDTMASISHVGNVGETLDAKPDADDLEPAADHEALKTIRTEAGAYEGAGGADASDTRRINRGRR